MSLPTALPTSPAPPRPTVVRPRGGTTRAAHLVRTAATATALLLLAGCSWWCWLGWDAPGGVPGLHGDGVYHLWQGAGCLLTVLALARAGCRRLTPGVVGVAVGLGFSGGYAADVLGRDPQGPAALAVAVVALGAAKGALALSGLLPPTGSSPDERRPAGARRPR